jgi:hypothetical protein
MREGDQGWTVYAMEELHGATGLTSESLDNICERHGLGQLKSNRPRQEVLAHEKWDGVAERGDSVSMALRRLTLRMERRGTFWRATQRS